MSLWMGRSDIEKPTASCPRIAARMTETNGDRENVMIAESVVKLYMVPESTMTITSSTIFLRLLLFSESTTGVDKILSAIKSDPSPCTKIDATRAIVVFLIT